MATAIHSGPSQQPVSIANTTNVDLISYLNNIIREITGNPPTSAEHLYNLLQYLKDYPHPCPTVIENSGGTLPTASPCQPIADYLQGWEDVSSQDLNYVRAIFQHVPERDQSLAYDHFLRALGRAPRVQEFSRFLLIYEGNDLTDSSRKTLGQLYLENEEFRETLNRHLRTIDLHEQMLSSKDTMIQALGQSNDQNKTRVDMLENQKANLESIIRSIQHQKADLQHEHNALKRDHGQLLAQLEDERKDKQVFKHKFEQLQVFKHRFEQSQADKLALQNTVTSQTDTITHMQVTIHEHEHDIDRLKDKAKELRKKLHKESNDKSAILQELEQKLELLSKLEEDREIFMMENRAQRKYVLELKAEKMKLQKENEVLKESAEMCRIILAEQYDTIIQTLEASLFTLNENLTQMKKRNVQLSDTVADLESKNSDLESMTEQQSVTISDLESMTEQQSITISDLKSKNSDLESKNSDLESMTEQQSVTISDLESKNSDLESKTEQQSVTISDLESKNSDLESKNSDLESMTEQQSVTITALETKLQQQNQKQQYFILFMAALIFAMVCLQFLFQRNNLPFTS